MAKSWQVWADSPEVEGTLVRRARNELPPMESTKQAAKLIGSVYKSGMRVLDVGCNAGNYLRGLLPIDADMNYIGVDAYKVYIDQAKDIYKDFPNVMFAVKDIFKPLYPKDPCDIVFCCNVILHLPDFRVPIKNLLNSTRKYCFIRTLVGSKNTIVKRVVGDDFDKKNEPRRFSYQNTYTESLLKGYINSLGWKCEFIDDEFDPNILKKEFNSVKSGTGTNVIGGEQVDGNIIFRWKFIKITPMRDVRRG
jgi:SAM-dependent methyltransferase